MYRTGCVMQLTAVEEHDDGRFDIAVVGRHRMRVISTDTAGPFLQAEVEHLAPEGEATGPSTAHEAVRALGTFESYRGLVSALTDQEVDVGKLPRDPELLSFALAAACPLTLAERQRLLEAATTEKRLQLLRALMHEEERVMRTIPSLPATDVARTSWNPN
jgi:Lon protease-like protein